MRSRGIYIIPERIHAINELKALVDQKGIQSLFGNINFVQRFIPDYASIVNSTTKLFRKDHDFEWTLEAQI